MACTQNRRIAVSVQATLASGIFTSASAGLLLTTDVAVSERVEDKPEAGGGARTAALQTV